MGAEIEAMTSDSEAGELWQRAVEGDREAFTRLTEPLLGRLREAATHELEHFVAVGELPEDATTAEEVVGEVLLRAWRQRHRKPADFRLEPWLLSILYRVIDALVHEHRRKTELAEALAGQHPEAPPLEDDDEFWEWFQPEDLPIAEPLLPQAPPSPEEIAAKLGARPRLLSTASRRALWLHQRHRLAVREIGAVLKKPAAEVRELVETAAERIRRSEEPGAP
ncbi:hypothetical protein HRbin40_01973 [bacterium HR40]|nr:hypothetical protein HRbin40_01973 [bacterium HR40]